MIDCLPDEQICDVKVHTIYKLSSEKPRVKAEGEIDATWQEDEN
jgi:hypothetical protein